MSARNKPESGHVLKSTKSASQHIQTYSRHPNLYCSHRILACTYILIQKIIMLRISFLLTQSAMDMFSVALLNRKTLKHTHMHARTHTHTHTHAHTHTRTHTHTYAHTRMHTHTHTHTPTYTHAHQHTRTHTSAQVPSTILCSIIPTLVPYDSVRYL